MDIISSCTFDDVLLEPAYSSVMPSETDIKTQLTKRVSLGIPILSAAMDTVTESRLAIAIAQHGGIGVIHKNLSIEEQVKEVKKVKRFESGVVRNPIFMNQNQSLAEALELMKLNNITSIPVTDDQKKLVGILTNRDVRFQENINQPIHQLMTKKLITAQEGISLTEAKRLLHQNRIEKLLIVDKDNFCTGLITVNDIEKSAHYPFSCKDINGRLRVAAAVGVGSVNFERSQALIESGCDILCIDTAHGHSQKVLDQISNLRSFFPEIDIIAGNIATKEAALALIQAGANTIKVGIGPGSICTTRTVAGVGVPQLSAIYECSLIAKQYGVSVIADGGIQSSGDIAKAIAAGADCVMLGSLFAGCDESPGEVFLYQGRSYKSYRGMGSDTAMQCGSADRYFQDSQSPMKYVPEGVEGRVPYKGSITHIIHQMTGGLRAAMGYTGHKNLKSMQHNCRMRKMTSAGLRESHVHNVTITKEAPNYHFSYSSI